MLTPSLIFVTKSCAMKFQKHSFCVLIHIPVFSEGKNSPSSSAPAAKGLSQIPLTITPCPLAAIFQPLRVVAMRTLRRRQHVLACWLLLYSSSYWGPPVALLGYYGKCIGSSCPKTLLLLPPGAGRDSRKVLRKFSARISPLRHILVFISNPSDAQ